MRNFLIVAVALFALFILGALFAGGAAFYLLRVRAGEAQVQALQARTQAEQARKQAMQAQTAAAQAQISPRPARPTMKAPKAAPLVRAQLPSLRLPGRAGMAATDFPLPPSKDGSVVERWEGCYYYAMVPFEEVLAQNMPRTRFWFDVRRSEQENFN